MTATRSGAVGAVTERWRGPLSALAFIAALTMCDQAFSENIAEHAGLGGWAVAVEDYQKPGLEALARPDALLPQRYAEVRLILPFDAVLEAGQPPPPREQQDEYVAKRADAIAHAECETIKRFFAAKCTVRQAEAMPHHNATYRIEMELLFTPKDNLSQVPAADDLAYEERLIDLPWMEQFDPSKETANRYSRYAQAMAACDALRATTHVCTLLKVEVTAGSRPRLPAMIMTGSATLAILRRKSKG